MDLLYEALAREGAAWALLAIVASVLAAFVFRQQKMEAQQAEVRARTREEEEKRRHEKDMQRWEQYMTSLQVLIDRYDDALAGVTEHLGRTAELLRENSNVLGVAVRALDSNTEVLRRALANETKRATPKQSKGRALAESAPE